MSDTETLLRLPWGNRSTIELPIPSRWDVVGLRMADAAGLEDDAIVAALDAPIEAASLGQLVGGRPRVAIVIDDATRPTPTARILRLLTSRLAEAGVPAARITIVIARGAHGRMRPRDLERKVGLDLLGSVSVVEHNPETDVVETGVLLDGVPVRISRTFMEADVRIGIGSVMPHPLAGFSGGAKLVVPGLADLAVLTRTHKFAIMGLRGGAGLAGNRFRSEMESAVRRIGLHWTINIILNGRCEPAAVYAGDMVSAHRRAASDAERIGATRRPERPLDALVLNAYPKDGELLQAESALVALRQGLMEWLAPRAPVVLAAACPDGLGTHRLFGPGGSLYRPPAQRAFLRGHPLWIFAPGIDEQAVRQLFPPAYPFARNWSDVLSGFGRDLRDGASIGVVACGPLQLAVEPAPVHALEEGHAA